MVVIQNELPPSQGGSRFDLYPHKDVSDSCHMTVIQDLTILRSSEIEIIVSLYLMMM